MLGAELTLADLETIDASYHKSLLWMLANPVAGVFDHLTFEADVEEFGRTTSVGLLPGGAGADVGVTDENKADYVHRIVDFTLTRCVEAQLRAFIEGFHEIIPRELVSIFTPPELELVLCGLPDIDVADLKAHTVYNGFGASPQTHRSVLMFWELVAEMDQEDLARLVLFVTGTSKVPITGFKSLQHPFAVQAMGTAEVDTLPRAHTCFNQLDLPQYSSMDVMRERFLLALREGSLGFGAA
jgi:E3 ubiquitin-protein ligase HUWE1